LLRDALALKLSNRGKDEPTGIEISVFSHGAKAHDLRANGFDDVQKILQRAAQPVVRGDHYHSSFAKLLNHAVKPAPNFMRYRTFSHVDSVVLFCELTPTH
jgi:hypothetical protein